MQTRRNWRSLPDTPASGGGRWAAGLAAADPGQHLHERPLVLEEEAALVELAGAERETAEHACELGMAAAAAAAVRSDIRPVTTNQSRTPTVPTMATAPPRPPSSD